MQNVEALAVYPQSEHVQSTSPRTEKARLFRVTKPSPNMLAGIHAMLENFLVDLHSGHCNLLLIRIIITVFNNCFLPTCRAYKICILPDKAILCREQERGPCLNPKFLDIPTMGGISSSIWIWSGQHSASHILTPFHSQSLRRISPMAPSFPYRKPDADIWGQILYDICSSIWYGINSWCHS